jgi:outer membrane protein OmpA-like peptidoglycan-associated protein
MWFFTKLADWWDSKKKQSEKILHEFVDHRNGAWWSIAIAGSVQTAMNLGEGFVDTIRLGDGVREGTAGGILKDGLRLLTVAGPVARLGRGISRFVAPNAKGGICAWVSATQALRQTGVRHFATIADLLEASGEGAPGALNLKALTRVLKSAGAEVRAMIAVDMKGIEMLAKANPHGVVMFGVEFETILRGAKQTVGHCLYAYRNEAGLVRIIDRSGRSVTALAELQQTVSPTKLGYPGIGKARVLGAVFVKDATIVRLLDGSSAAALEVRAVLLASRAEAEAEFGRRQMEHDLDRMTSDPEPIRVSQKDDSFAWILHGDMLFDFDKSDLKPAADQVLEQAWVKIKSMPRQGVVCIDGFTDSVGDDAYNLRLSERRAQSVAQWFFRRGYLTPPNVKTRGFGKLQPVAPNTTADGRAKNRRVEIFMYNR